jgi:hypothetical protein
MHPKLRRVLTDRVIWILSIAFVVHLLRVTGSTNDTPKTASEIAERLSQGERIEIPVGDGVTIPFEAPRDENGRPNALHDRAPDRRPRC